MKKIVRNILLFIFAITATTFFMQKDALANVYIDSMGNFVIETSDTIKTSNIWYRTEGFSISRGAFPAEQALHPSKEYVGENDMQSKTTITNVGGIQLNAFRVPLMTLIGNGSAAWVKEVQDALNGGPAVWIRFDSMMFVYHGIYKHSGPYINTPPYDGLNPAEIINAESWRNPNGLVTHYNRWIKIGGQEPPPPPYVGGDDTKITEEETEQFIWKTGNSSDEYNLGEGIPSSKDVTNEYIASRWWGETEVWARTVTEQKYTGIPYKYTYGIKTTKTVTDPVTGIPRTEETIEKKEYSGTFDELRKGINTTMVPAVAFEYLANANFYDLSVTGAYNLAFPNTIYYQSEEVVPMTAITTKLFHDIANEEIGKQKISSWYADNEKHIKWASVPEGVTKELGNFDSEAAALEAFENQYVTDRGGVQDSIANNTYTWNDHLKIDNKEYLKGAGAHKVAGVNWLKEGMSKKDITYKFCTNSAACKKPFIVGSIKNAILGEETGTETVTIPDNTDNGKYPTGLEVMYDRIIKNDKYSKIFRAGREWFSDRTDGTYFGELTDGHCLDSFGGYINVHTPVITPVNILDDQGGEVSKETQLALSQLNEDVQQQVILDENYVVDWEPFGHREIDGYGYSGDPSKYDEFVQDKFMRFPFCVEYNGAYYDLESTGFTQWIKVQQPDDWEDDANFQKASASNDWYPQSDNHWKMTPFYIPPYAIECGEKGTTKYAQFKVEAINVDGRYIGSHHDEDEDDHNEEYQYEYPSKGDAVNYVAIIRRYKMQLSGQIYDFMITGTSDKDTFMFEDKGKVDFDVVPFCEYKMEKRLGKYNRYGNASWDRGYGYIPPMSNPYGATALRYRSDGSVENNWKNVNTLPLMSGKSNCFGEMGYAIKGSSFSYSFKTIANLWDFDVNDMTDMTNLHATTGDRIRITPTFRYISPSGEIIPQFDADGNEKLKVYYKAYNTDEEYVEYGTARDLEDANAWKTKLSDKQFNYAYYDKTRTTERSGKIWQFGDWVNYTTDKENLALDTDLTIEEFLNRTTYSYCLSRINLNSRLRFLSGEWEELKRNICGNGRAYDGYIQTGHEKLLKLSDGSINWDAVLEDKFRSSMQTWYGQYHIPNYLYIVDLDKHGYGSDFELKSYIQSANGGKGIQYDDPIFEQGGYLIINFKIETINNGKPHLIYSGMYDGAKDMWYKEGFPDEIEIGDTPVDTVPGDVVVIDLSRSINDYYEPALFNIN